VTIMAKEKKKIFFFGYHRIGKMEELPESLSIKVTFDNRKNTFLYSLVRVLDTTYCLRLTDQNPPRRLT
jgi:hypothetical protein